MFNKKTLFVIGAGASCEVQLPSGAQLAQKIGQSMDIWWDDIDGRMAGSGDRDFFQAMTSTSGVRGTDLQRAALVIRDGILLSSSIDDFLDQHQADANVLLMGKAAIVRQILEAEKHSPMFVSPTRGRGLLRSSMDMARILDSWFVRFARMAGRNVTVANVSHIFDNIAFITFNYDRTLEHFLVHMLMSAFNIDPTQACAIVARTTVLHPYGSIGTLPGIGQSDVLPFGGVGWHNLNYMALSKRIRTYTESSGDDIPTAIAKAWETAERVIFLGFGFHRQNMELFSKAASMDGNKQTFATVMGISNSDQQVVARRIEGLFTDAVRVSRSLMGPPKYDDCKCFELLDRYRLTLID